MNLNNDFIMQRDAMCGMMQCNVSSNIIKDSDGLYKGQFFSQPVTTGRCTSTFYPTRTLGTVPNGTSCGANMVITNKNILIFIVFYLSYFIYRILYLYLSYFN